MTMPPENEKRYGEFKRVFDEYYIPLCNYAFSFVRDKAGSEDIVQEILLKVWEKRPDLIGKPSIRFYLFTSVRNNCLTKIQQNKKLRFIQPDHLEGSFMVAMEERQEGQEPDRLALVQKALSLLPSKCREVFLLSRIGNLSYKEIAGTLNISVKTVENQVGKALKIMKHFLKEHKLFTICCSLEFIRLLTSRFIGDLLNRLFY
jgi:RNA polymerase sigma-70 factor (ECF subfamily)